jgi:outer membrane receptor protein involved in Fe transport
MLMERRVLLCLELIAICGGVAARTSAQMKMAGVKGSGMVPQVEGSASGSAQQPHPSIGASMSLDLHEVTLKDALRAIANGGGVKLLYNDGDIPSRKLVSITVASMPVMQILGLVLHGTGLAARVTPAGVVIARITRGEVRGRQERRSSIGGQVTDAEAHKPIASVKIQLEETTSAALTDTDGRYRISDIPAGSYVLSARRVGYQKATQVVSVADGEDVVADLAMTPSPTVLDQVVTTGTVIPTAVRVLPSPISVITADDIERQHPFTISQILRQAVPNAVAFNTPNAPENTLISLRGVSSLLSGGGNVKIFVDGIDVSSSTLTPIDPVNIERIEVVRGPQASTLYGANAAGGVIQIFTKRGELGLLRPHLELRAMAGVAQTPYNDFKSVLRHEYTGLVQGGGTNASYSFGAGYTRVADYVPRNGESRQSNPRVYGATHFVNGMLTADLSARYNDHEVPVVENPMVRETGYAPESRPQFMVGKYANETYGVRLGVTPTGWWQNRFTAGVDRSTVRNTQMEPRLVTPDDTLLSLYDDRSRKLSIGFSSSFSASLQPDVNGSVTIGVDHYVLDESTFSTSQALNGTGEIRTEPPGGVSQSIDRVTNTGYFTQAQVNLRDAAFFTAGVRAEHNSSFGSRYGTVVLPRFGLSLVDDIGGATVKVRGSYGKAFRAPSPGLASGSATGSSIQLANPNLAPERQQGWDAGVDVTMGNAWSLSITHFDQTALDLIAFLQVASTPLPTSQYQNIGRVSNKGIEVEGTLRLSRTFSMTAQYGYVRSRIQAVGSAGGQVKEGDEPLGVPAHTAGATLDLTPRAGTTLSAGMTYVGGYRQTDFLMLYRCVATFSADDCPASFLDSFSLRGFVIPYPAYAKFNATISQRITSQLEAFLSIDNLANKEAYEPNNDVAVVGRTTTLGVHLSY